MRNIGIDIGGTKINVILWKDEKIVALFRARTSKTKKIFIKTLKAAVKKITGKGEEIKNIGISVAGVIGKNKIIFSPNIPYLKNFHFRNIFPTASVKIDNDARAFLRGELQLRKYDKNKKILAFTVGTGLGRAFAKNGKVEKIKKFEYPEEWEKEYQKIRDSKNTSALAEFLASRFAAIIRKYGPEIVLIGGGVSKNRNFFKQLKKKIKEQAGINDTNFKIQKAASENSAAIGASLLC